MLASGSSKTSQHVIGRVVSSGLGQGSYWSTNGHLGRTTGRYFEP